MLTGLDASTIYTVSVVASAPGYRSNEATEIFTTLDPQLAVASFVLVAGETTVQVIWGEAILNATTYVISVGVSELTDTTTVAVLPSAGSYEFTDLT